jgi:hypothetical protein
VSPCKDTDIISVAILAVARTLRCRFSFKPTIPLHSPVLDRALPKQRHTFGGAEEQQESTKTNVEQAVAALYILAG